MKYVVVVFLVPFFLLCSFAQADYYVDFENGRDTNTGLSASTPWKHAPGDPNATGNPASASLQPGDTVLFKGGVIYGGSISIKASGVSGNHITYRGDNWPDLEGTKAIVNGNHIKNTGYNYITIEGFRVQNAGILGDTPGLNMIVRNNEVSGNSGLSGAVDLGDIYDVRFEASDDVCIIENNYIHDTDSRGIYAGAEGGKLIIRNNTLERTPNGMRIESGGGTIVVINNKFYDCAPSGHTNVITIYHDHAAAEVCPSCFTRNILVAGNVVFGGQRPLAIHRADDLTVYNNILIAKEGSGTCPITVWGSGAKNVKVLNNVLFSGYTPPITLYGIGAIDNLIMKNNIIARPVDKPGADISHNIYTVLGSSSGTNEIYEPDLTKILADVSGANRADWNYHLKPGSIAIDAGTDITSILNELQLKYGEYYDFTKDIAGDPRPQGAGWDIGAYEYPGVIDTEPPTVPQTLIATAVSHQQIDLSWDASTDNVALAGYKIYREGVEIATSTTVTYSDTELTPSTTYTYQVLAYDFAGNESDKSPPVSATTLADTTPPSIVSVITQETSINIVFNEALDTLSAENITNYSINNGISITQASLGFDLITVTLTTSSHTDGLTYTLTVEDVKDTALNPIQPTQIDYVYRADVTDGLIAHWKLDEEAGTTAQDSSGNGHDGTLINGPLWTEGRINYALDFDGSNDKVTIPHHDDLDPESMTIAAWVYLEQSKAWSAVLTKDEQVSYWLGVGGTTPLFLLSPDGSSGNHIRFWADSGMTLNTWHHIAATYDGSYVQLYIDGSSSGSPQGYNGGIYQGTSQVLIGDSITWQPFSNTFNGIIDDVRIYNRALGQEEIQAIYDAAPIMPLPQYTFDASLEGWSFLPLSGPGFSGAWSGYSGGRISISSANDTTNRVGFWIGPLDIPCLADNVYRARFLASSSQATASANPQFRMRWTQDQSLESASHVVNPSGSYSNSLPTDPIQREYAIYFAPILAYNLGVAFDMVDFDAGQYGTHYVDRITVERFPRLASGTSVKTYSSSADFANWQFLTNVGYGPVTSGGDGTGTLSIASSLADSSNSGFWQSSWTANELTYVADKLYRATYTLRCATDAARNDMPQIRLRCQNDDAQMTKTMELNSQGAGGPGAMPTVGGTGYELYWETPILPGSPTPSEDGFVVTIDLLDFNAAKGGTIYMDSVAVDYLTIPYP